MTIDRYDLYNDGFDNCSMKRYPNGDYILYEDYEQVMKDMQAEIDDLREEVANAWSHVSC